MPSTPFTSESALSFLAETPARIAASTAGLSPAQLRKPPAPGEWSVNDVLAHLRACADVRGDYILRMLTDDRPELRAVSPRTYMKKTDYPDLDFAPSFDAFARQRAELLAVLDALAPEDWTRSAIVNGVGRPFEHTVLSYAEWLVVHERPHLKQVESIVSTIAPAPTPP